MYGFGVGIGAAGVAGVDGVGYGLAVGFGVAGTGGGVGIGTSLPGVGTGTSLPDGVGCGWYFPSDPFLRQALAYSL